jgi:hypothetical protein
MKKAIGMHVESRKSRQLDEALGMTFPASDPPAIGDPTSTEPPRRPTGKEHVPVAAGRTGRVHRPARQGGKPDTNAPPEPVPNIRGKNRSYSDGQKGQGGEGFSKGYGGSGGLGTRKSGADDQQ